MMKILIIEGSPRHGCNTDLLSNEFARGAVESGHGIEKIYLQRKKVAPCIDCEACQTKRQGCIQKDDFGEICEKMIASDVLVFATPVYFYSVSAQMKALFDRCYSILERLSGKRCCLLSAGAADATEYFDTLIACYRGFIHCFPDMKECGTVLAYGAQAKGSVVGNKAMQEAYQLGKNIN